MLHQGGFERVCVTTARLLEPYADVFIVMFDSKDIAYDIKGLHVTDLHLGVREGKAGKMLNVIKRSLAVRKLKKEWGIDIACGAQRKTHCKANAFRGYLTLAVNTFAVLRNLVRGD